MPKGLPFRRLSSDALLMMRLEQLQQSADRRFVKKAVFGTAVAPEGPAISRIEAILGDRGPGHCMRVTDLDDDVMESVCKELRRTRPDGNIFILGSHDQEGMPFRVTSTKLVELRNPNANGELRQRDRKSVV